MSITLPSKLLALLEAVKDHPDSDAHRLVLADWLEEHGRDDAERARADFTRLQCQRARLLAATWNHRILTAQPQYQDLVAQEASLRRAHLPSWLGVWHSWIVRPADEAEWFQRGMLRPWVKGVQWLEEVPDDSGAWAWVDGLVVLSLRAEDVLRLAASPALRRLNALDLGSDDSPVGDAGARALASSPYLTRLTTLVLTDTGIGPAGARALAESPYLRQLTSLELLGFDWTTSNHVGDEGVRALAGSEHLARLTCLRLPENGITAEGARALAESPYLGGLTYLELSANPVGPEGARALASSCFLTRLTYLGLQLSSSPFHSAGHGVQADADQLEDAREVLRKRFGKAWSGETRTTGG
jgi:uncharacterized protein (TIGR02996 family)